MRKKIKIFLLLLIFILSYAINNVSAYALNNIIVNNSNNLDWNVIQGKDVVVNQDSIHLSGEKLGSDLEIIYNKKLNFSNIMLDFNIGDEFAENSKLCFIFYDTQNQNSLCSFIFYFKENYYDVCFCIQDMNYYFNNMKCVEKGHLQARLSKDIITNYSTGEKQEDWNLVFGIQKNSITLKNDEYSVRMNRFDCDDFIPFSEKLDEIYDKNNQTQMKIFAETTELKKLEMDIFQISLNCFYNYYIFSNLNINLIKCDYTNISFQFSHPEGEEYKCAGYLIERFKNGNSDKIFIYTSEYSNFLSDSNLNQNTKYTYTITALKSISSTNRVACNRIAYKYEEIEISTPKGNPTALIISIFIIILVATVGILIYIFWYDIKKGCKRNAF